MNKSFSHSLEWPFHYTSNNSSLNHRMSLHYLQVPALAHGLVGVLRVRFSPLWPATVQALAACLQFQTKVCWSCLVWLHVCPCRALSSDARTACPLYGISTSTSCRNTCCGHFNSMHAKPKFKPASASPAMRSPPYLLIKLPLYSSAF